MKKPRVNVDSNYLKLGFYVSFALLGAFLLQGAITGLVTQDITGTLCESENQCFNAQVCCKYSGGDNGLCVTQDRCEEIQGMSSTDAQFLRPGQAEGNVLFQQQAPVFLQAWAGVLLLFIAGSVAVHHHRSRK